jgi:hypothetical protein
MINVAAAIIIIVILVICFIGDYILDAYVKSGKLRAWWKYVKDWHGYCWVVE